MKRIGVVLLFALLCAIIYAREFRSIEEIKKSGVLRILQTEDYWYPFYYLDSDGNLSGIDIELGRHIASQLGVEAEFIRTASGHETLAENLSAGEGDIILSYYSYSPRRASQIFLSRAYLTERLSVLVNTQLFEEIKKNDPEMSVEEAFETLNRPVVSIMTVADTVYESLAEQYFPNARVTAVDSTEEASRRLVQRTEEAFFLNNLWTESFLVRNTSLLLHYSLYLLPNEDQIVIGVSQNNPELLEWINRFLSSEYNRTEEFVSKYIDFDLVSKLYDPVDKKEEILLVGDPYRWIILALLIVFSIVVVHNSQNKLRRNKSPEDIPHWLLNIWTILFSMVLGFYVGGAFPEIIDFLSPIGTLFFNYLLFCGLPILFCVVTLNFLKLIERSDGARFIKRFAMVMIFFFVIGAAIGLLTALVLKPGVGIPIEAQEALVSSMRETDPYEEVELSAGSIIWALPSNMIGNSVVKAFSENRTLTIVFFSIIFAFAVRYIQSSKRTGIVNSVETINDAFLFLFRLSYYVLPIGIFSLMLGQASIFIRDTEVLIALVMLIVCEIVCFIIWFLIGTLLGARKASLSPKKYLGVIKKPMMLLFALLSSVAVIPEAVKTCEKSEQFNDENQKGVIPLLLVMFQPQTVSLFVVVAIFNMQLLGKSLNAGDYLYIMFSSIIAVFASIGVPSPLDLFTISMVVLPFNIPPAQVIFFLLPWMYTGRRLDTLAMVTNDFAVVQFFRKKQTKTSDYEAL